MSFDIEAVLGDMLAAMEETAGPDWDEIEEYAKQILDNEKEMLADLAEQRLKGEITEDELNSELEDERYVFEAEMKAVQVMTKAMAQRAANAAIEVLSNAIKAAM